MTAAIRKRLATELEARLGKRRFQIVPNVGTVDRLAKPLIQLELAAFEPSQGARGQRRAELTVHVATHLEGITAQAEDKIDDLAFEVFETLEQIAWVNPTRATKVVYKSRHMAYEITTEILTRRR